MSKRMRSVLADPKASKQLRAGTTSGKRQFALEMATGERFLFKFVPVSRT